MKKISIVEAKIENSPVLEKEAFKKNADFIYNQWKPVQIGDFETCIFDAGQGEPVIVVPICRGLEAFDSLIIQSLSKTHRVITFKRRENDRKILGADIRADDIKKVMDYLNITKAHFVSHSSGSIATTTLALKHPELFLSYVWMNLSADPAGDLSFVKKQTANFVKYLPISSNFVLKVLSKTCCSGNTRSLLYQRIYEQFGSVTKTNGVTNLKRWFVRNVWTLSNYNWTTGLEVLLMPILLINSDNDFVNSVDAMRGIEKQLPNCHGFKIVNGGWHLFQYTRSEQVNKFMEEFYAKLKI